MSGKTFSKRVPLVLAAAQQYLGHGWCVVPVPAWAKVPRIREWEKLQLTAEELPRHFSETTNIGIHTGGPSGGLVDVDCDVNEAVSLAAVYLPATDRIHGRPGNPRSHWWYIAPDARYEKFALPARDKDGRRAGETCLIELRSDGHQTIVPPSRHPNGETYMWHAKGEPTRVESGALHLAVARVAAGAALARAWPGEGSRDDAALALTGMLLRAGWSVAEADRFVVAVAAAAGDEEAPRRAKGRRTWGDLDAGRQVYGAPKLAELLADGATVVEHVKRWLALPQRGIPTQETRQIESVQEWQPTIQTASELMGKTLPPVRWAVKDIIAEGVTLLAGKAKKGKSTLMLHIGMSVAQGTIALGKLDTEAGDVLYLALEDNERRMQRRIRGMLGHGENVPVGLQIAYQWLPLEQGGSEALERYLDAHPTVQMVIVDTLHHVRSAPRGNGNGYAEDYAACRELLRIAGARQIAIVVLTHLRKAPAEDPFDEINATGGLLAGVDNALVLRPAGGDGLMELHRRGREFEDDSTLALRGDRKTLRWSFAGQAESIMRSAERQAIIDVLPSAGAMEGMRPGEIAAALGKPVGAIRKLLYSLMHEGEPTITRDQRGGYFALSNASNVGNGSRRNAEECTREVRSPTPGGVPALPLLSSGGNAGSALEVSRPLGGVTTVTDVTGVTTSEDVDGEELEAYL